VTPAGLISVQPGFRTRIIALYTLLAVVAIALPALLSQPRGSSSHPIHQEARRPAVTDTTVDASRR